MTRRRWIIASAILVLLVVAGIVLANWRGGRNAAGGVTAAVRTAKVERRAMSNSVDATGSLAPSRQEALYNKVAAKVDEILVQPGELVKSGQILVRMVSPEAELALANAKDSLELARSKLAVARENYEKTAVNNELAYQKAYQERLNAVLRLKTLENQPDEGELEQARANLRQAQVNLQAAERELASREALLQAGAISSAEYELQLSQVESARESVRLAEWRLKNLEAGPDPLELEAARISLQQAEINLALAEQNMKKEASKDAVIQAEVEVRQAENALRAAEENLASLTLKAPFDGMVLAVNVTKGQELPSGSANSPVVTVAAAEKWLMEGYVDEMDISSVKPGQPVKVILAAMEDKELSGKVLSIGGVARVSYSVVTYPLKVELNTYDPIFRPGMTADAEIQVVFKPNALVVPERAVTIRRGEALVQVPGAEPGADPVWVPVEVGLRSNGFIEIVSGLEEGQEVIVSGPVAFPGAAGGAGRGPVGGIQVMTNMPVSRIMGR
ncbi:MAG TPA: efflux RND transporter periplasmic adaptor subunit [Firmicutes bacterium]|nr:efflux RND transporter periplasmic adaptor subunit [Bacillota bacterium]